MFFLLDETDFKWSNFVMINACNYWIYHLNIIHFLRIPIIPGATIPTNLSRIPDYLTKTRFSVISSSEKVFTRLYVNYCLEKNFTRFSATSCSEKNVCQLFSKILVGNLTFTFFPNFVARKFFSLVFFFVF